MERDLIRELTEQEKEIAVQWQVFPEIVRLWVDELRMPIEDFDETVEWALKDNHFDLIMEAKREFFEASLFSRKLRPELSEPAS
jgi:hypothetical protein